MADWKVILIIALIAFGIFWYKSPDKATGYIDTGIDKVQGIWSNQKLICSQNYDPVCGEDKVTYDNECLAQKANQMNITLGVC